MLYVGSDTSVGVRRYALNDEPDLAVWVQVLRLNAEKQKKGSIYLLFLFPLLSVVDIFCFFLFVLISAFVCC